MNSIEWIFSGIGTQVICGIVGAFIGGLIGYRIRDKKIVRQSQVAGDYSYQRQEFHNNASEKTKKLEDTASDNVKKKKIEQQEILNQHQKAGYRSIQVQVGDFSGDNRR